MSAANKHIEKWEENKEMLKQTGDFFCCLNRVFCTKR